MYVLLALSPFVWAFFAFNIYRKLKAFRVEVQYLPKMKGQTGLIPAHPAIGVNVFQLIPFPADYVGKVFYLMAAMPTCSSCSSQLEEFIEFADRNMLPFVTLIPEGIPGYEEYSLKYRDVLPVYVINNNVINDLYLFTFPSFLIINKIGEVVAVKNSALATIHNAMDILALRGKKES